MNNLFKKELATPGKVCFGVFEQLCWPLSSNCVMYLSSHKGGEVHQDEQYVGVFDQWRVIVSCISQHWADPPLLWNNVWPLRLVCWNVCAYMYVVVVVIVQLLTWQVLHCAMCRLVVQQVRDAWFCPDFVLSELLVRCTTSTWGQSHTLALLFCARKIQCTTSSSG